MGRYDRIMHRVLSGKSDANIPFDDLCALLRHLDFDERVRGSHHIFRKTGLEEKLNLQESGGRSQALSGAASQGDVVPIPTDGG